MSSFPTRATFNTITSLLALTYVQNYKMKAYYLRLKWLDVGPFKPRLPFFLPLSEAAADTASFAEKLGVHARLVGGESVEVVVVSFRLVTCLVEIGLAGGSSIAAMM